MILDLLTFLLVAVYMNQYRKWYMKGENEKHDDFVFFMCVSSILLSVALILFRPVKNITVRTL